MRRLLHGPTLRGVVASGAVGVLVAAGSLVGTAAVAETSPDLTLDVTYPVNGTTHLASTDSDLNLGPGELAASIELPGGDLSADLSLPPATGSFKEFGVVPVTATTEFVQESPTTGTVDLITGHVSSTSAITVKLDSVKVAGIPVPVGDSCQTRSPATIHLESEPGFNAQTGGTLTGTYAIPKFSGCGLATPLINLTIPGDGNTISLDLGEAH